MRIQGPVVEPDRGLFDQRPHDRTAGRLRDPQRSNSAGSGRHRDPHRPRFAIPVPGIHRHPRQVGPGRWAESVPPATTPDRIVLLTAPEERVQHSPLGHQGPTPDRDRHLDLTHLPSLTLPTRPRLAHPKWVRNHQPTRPNPSGLTTNPESQPLTG